MFKLLLTKTAYYYKNISLQINLNLESCTASLQCLKLKRRISTIPSNIEKFAEIAMDILICKMIGFQHLK